LKKIENKIKSVPEFEVDEVSRSISGVTAYTYPSNNLMINLNHLKCTETNEETSGWQMRIDMRGRWHSTFDQYTRI